MRLLKVFSPQKQAKLCDEDKALMQFFADYFLRNQITMSVPQFRRRGTATSKQPPVCELIGYEQYPLSDGESFFLDGLQYFLRLLLAGAHFVSLHAERDTTEPVTSFYYDFKKRFYSLFPSLSAESGTAMGHSHYKWKGPSLGTAMAYPFRYTLGGSARKSWPLIPILLVDTTTWAVKSLRQHNTFFQMEGWSTGLLHALYQREFKLAGKGGVRHGADFLTHDATKWNISTYGACAYSEKRGGTVFLHHRNSPPPRPSHQLVMHSYAGAESPSVSMVFGDTQGWLARKLVYPMARRTLDRREIPDRTGMFLNDLFKDPARQPAEFVNKIVASANNGQHISWLISPSEVQLLCDELGRAVRAAQGVRVGPQDQALMEFFRGFFLDNEIAMSVPVLELDGEASVGAPPRYKLSGYTRYELSDGHQIDGANLSQFLKLLLAGAHFVVLHAARDTTGKGSQAVDSFYYEFKERFYALGQDEQAGTAFGHSHYKMMDPSVGTALAYPFSYSSGASAGRAWPLVPILLVDTTSWAWDGARDHNTFFQMEGWSTGLVHSLFTGNIKLALKGGVRHGADFETHDKTKWNISTYGACVYSEKRGGTVFLHHRSLPSLKPQLATIMHSYVGAETNTLSWVFGSTQRWLDTSLVAIKQDD
jgi:hypothetical protein